MPSPEFGGRVRRWLLGSLFAAGFLLVLAALLLRAWAPHEEDRALKIGAAGLILFAFSLLFLPRKGRASASEASRIRLRFEGKAVRESFQVFADHHQFYLEDPRQTQDASDLWSGEESAQKLATRPGLLAVATASGDTVPVQLEVRPDPPEDGTEAWDFVHDAEIAVRSGTLRLAGISDDPDSAPLIALPPGPYRARIYYSLERERDFDGLEAKLELYRIVLWPETRPVEPASSS